MTAPTCAAQACAGVADDGSGLCSAHRRSLTLTTKVQDAVREFLHGNLNPSAVIRPTPENARKVVEAGTHIAQGLALLIATRFDDMSFDPSPIYVHDLSSATNTPWRVSFSWQANQLKEEQDDDEDEELDDELEMAQP